MKLEAFTIMESMMALIIIMISFTAGITLYLTILQGDAFPLKTKAKNILNNVYLETKNEQRFLDESLEKEGFIIEKKMFPYKGYQGVINHQNLYQLTLQAFSPNNDLIAEQEHLIYVGNEN